MAARRRTASAFRPGTKANQRLHVLLYVAFSKFFQETDFPAAAGHLLRFAEFVLRSCRAHWSATNALASVRTFHLQCGFDVQAFADFRLVLWKRALPAMVRHVPWQAPPLPLGLLDRLCALATAIDVEGRVFSCFRVYGTAVIAGPRQGRGF